MWTFLKRTFCLCLSIRSKFKISDIFHSSPLSFATHYISFFFRAHWYLVVICFPGLMEPQVEAWKGPMSDCQTGKSLTCELPDQEAPNDDTETAPPSMHCGIMDTESGVLDWEWVIIYFAFNVFISWHVWFHVFQKTLKLKQLKALNLLQW